jgi:tetratricopeptide (TPR) repeat protein
MGKKSQKKKHEKFSKAHMIKGFNVQTTYQAGLDFFKNGDYHAAVVEWQKIPEAKYPEKMNSLLAEACFRKGLQLYRQLSGSNHEKTFNQMMATFSQAINFLPDKSIYHYHLGLAYYRFGNIKKAISSYKRAYNIDKNDRYLFHLILALYQQENVIDANNYLQLLEHKNESLSVLTSIMNHNEKKLSDLNFKEKSLANYFLAGIIHLKSKDYKMAATSFLKAVKFEVSEGGKENDTKIIGYVNYFLALINQKSNVNIAKQYWEKLLTFDIKNEQMKKNLAMYFFIKGIKLAQKGKVKKAIIPLENAQTIQPHNEIITQKMNLAKFLHANQIAQKGKIDEAIKLWYSCPIKNDINRIINIALALDQLNQPKEANFQWTKVIEYWKKELHSGVTDIIKNYLITAHKHLAENYIKINNERRAIKEFENVLKYLPNDIEIRDRLGNLLMENGRWSNAIKQFRTILKLKPNNIDALLNIAFLYDQSYDYKNAISVLENILTIEPKNSQARRKMGEIYHDLALEEWEFGNFDQAENLFKKQIDVDPKKFDGYSCLCDIYFETSRKKDVEKILNEYIHTDPNDPFVHLQVAQIYFEYGFKNKGNKCLTKALQLNPEDYKMLIELGKTIIHSSPTKAKVYFDKAIKLATDKPQVLYEIGVWLGQKNPKMAITYLNKYLKFDKENIEVLFLLGLIHKLNHNKKESQKAFSAAIRFAKQQGEDEVIDTIKQLQQDIDEYDVFGEQLPLF